MRIIHTIILLLLYSVGFGQAEISTQDGTYKMDEASADFMLGKIMYESYKYTDPEEYKKDRIRAIDMIAKSAESGFAPAQYYLGVIYLNDTLINDYNKAVGLLKKSAYQRNTDAIGLLDKLGEDYEVAINYKFRKKIIVISFLVLIYLLLSLIAQRKISNSNLITLNHKKKLTKLNWLLPYFGSIIGLNKYNKIEKPLDKGSIEWVNGSFKWIINELGNETILNSEIIIPLKENIPIDFNGTEECAKEAVGFIATKMQMNKDLIEVDFYNQSQMELDGNFVTQQYEDDKYSSGEYWGKLENGKYQISIEKSQLNNPITLVATIAHELSHVKLLGENKVSENNEHLTDLIPIVFGFGIFNANSIFQYYQDSFGWKASSQGYLNEKMYGFALAKFAIYRNDFKADWSKYLTSTIKEEFEKSMIYIKEYE